ncbi:retrotransposon-related protein [Tanacetum coccineum]
MLKGVPYPDTSHKGVASRWRQRLRVVAFNLYGAAAEWFRWMTRNNLIISWDGFLGSVRNRFGPCQYENPQGALSKLLQTGTVAHYQGEFEKLMHRVLEVRLEDQGVTPPTSRSAVTGRSQTLTKTTTRFTTKRLENPKPPLLSMPVKVGNNSGATRSS